ncbi:MAG TPA: DNA mismatch repair protein MutS [Syntrophomonadaceae bacterium]|nr:DNA mismatch repair protein MutS [Syntrophomonadaceae bacterium]HRX21064.1 DNA mismatch repair protein MutS [Syntrophomonadaceae bacterium]
MSHPTPMIQQYLAHKELHKDAILFFRLGDFYEMFFDDAVLAAKELEIVLTARDNGENKVPMCGVPHHSAAGYIAKLISRGYKVAICEQIEDPKAAKGIVKREITQIITPGTVLDDNMLPDSSNNYLAAIYENEDVIGFAYSDISTGEFKVTEFTGSNAFNELMGELFRLRPSECLLPPSATLDDQWTEKSLQNIPALFTRVQSAITKVEDARVLIREQMDMGTDEDFAEKLTGTGILAAGLILVFLQETCQTSLPHIKTIQPYRTENFVEMDASTRRNLELSSTIREGKREGSLLSVLDFCNTAMGKRKLKRWLEQPSRDIYLIERRLDGVEEIKSKLVFKSQVQKALSNVYDMERIAGRIGSGIASPRDLTALKISIAAIRQLKEVLLSAESDLLKEIGRMDPLNDVYQIISEAIADDPPLGLKEGGIIKPGYHSEIDELKRLSQEGSQWLVDFETREKQRTGIKYLKVGFNKVFGYFIEVSKSNLHMIPLDYHRKQTLVNTERFINEELKNYEGQILGAREKLFVLEYEEFTRIREAIAAYIGEIQTAADLISDLDVIYSLGEAAYLNHYVRPRLHRNRSLEIKAGRHPVVEKYLQISRFVPNDIKMDNDNRFAIITGPNMGGKSTFMRQTALLVLMAQIGSFIPADSADIGIVDKIFTRVGASDDLAAGQSTFMVEMVEVANILDNATRDSLIILDEIGRGTSTYDGLSLAKAVSEYITEHIKARTLFATHYHELTELEKDLPPVFNLSVSVLDSGDNVVFLKKVLPGKADKSYGIHVARMAGINNPVIVRAQTILEGLEKEKTSFKVNVLQQELFPVEDPFTEELQRLEIDSLSPKEALLLIYRWKEMLKNR